MGIGFLDLTFQLEKRFRIDMPHRMDEWEPYFVLGPRGLGLDLTAGAVAGVVAGRVRGRELAARSVVTGPVTGGFIVEYESAVRRSPPAPVVPGTAAAVWPGVVEAICDASGCHAADVTPEARLFADLDLC